MGTKMNFSYTEGRHMYNELMKMFSLGMVCTREAEAIGMCGEMNSHSSTSKISNERLI